jgi:hypothetical protein
MKQQRRWVAALESSVTKSSSRPICADGNVTGIAQRAVASPTQGNRPLATWRLRDARSGGGCGLEINISAKASHFSNDGLMIALNGPDTARRTSTNRCASASGLVTKTTGLSKRGIATSSDDRQTIVAAVLPADIPDASRRRAPYVST